MHYPGHLRDAFHAAFFNYLLDGDAELDEGLFWTPSMQCRWMDMSLEDRLMWIAGKLWQCTDVLPGETCEALDMEAGSTYAQACRLIRRGGFAPLKPV